MSRVRNEYPRMNHRSGKVPFYQRAEALAAEGDKMPIISAYSKVYAADPEGAKFAEQMKEKGRQALRELNGFDSDTEESVIDYVEPLPVETQLNIISQVLGPKRGTYVAGAGRAFKRPPLPRGGARASDLITQKMKAQIREEVLKEVKEEYEARIAKLEGLMTGSASANQAHNNSEGATSYGPNV